MITCRTLLAAALTCAVALTPACSDDGGDDKDTTTSATDATDATTDDDTATATVEPDATTEDTDAAPSCENPCLDEFGKNDRSLCPDPKSDWRCEVGCCVAVFKCATDADCTTGGFDEGQCTDDRFACLCDTGSGACYEWLCGGDADCDTGETCSAGACVPTAGQTGLSPRILNAPIVLVPGATSQLFVEAYDPADIDVVTAANATYASSDADVASVDATGLVTGGTEAGIATITVTLDGEGTTADVDVRNVVPIADGLTVIVVDQDTGAPVQGDFYVADADGEVFNEAIGSDGVFTIGSDFETNGLLDVHVFADDHDWVSYMGVASDAVILAVVAPTTYSLVDVDMSGALTEETQLVNVGLVQGAPDDSDYHREGQIELSLTSFGLSSALFDFSLPVLLGADVKRFLDPNNNIPGVDASEPIQAPGGIIFGLAGPALPSFILTAPAGTHRLWTLGGRLDIGEIAEYSAAIFDAVGGGDLDITQIAASIFPTFSAFWSGYDPAVTITQTEQTDAIVSVSPKLRMPLALDMKLDVPPLPAIGELGWADALFFLGGAMTPDGELVPLGLNGGSDTSNKETNAPDGIADADEKTPAKDPYNLPLAPLHSGLQGPHTRYGVAVVAVSIPVGSSDPRPDGGSAIIWRGEPGEGPATAPDLGSFLDFATTSTWNPDNRMVTIGAVDGADAQRVLFKGKKGANWTVWAIGRTSFAVPVPAEVASSTYVDRATVEVQNIMINSLDFRDTLTLASVLSPGGVTFSTLLGYVARLSFIDVRDPIFPE